MSTDADIIIALARKLEAQNPSTLEAENAQLRRERDQLKADAMSDLINRHRLENQVRNREAERDELKAERDDLQRRFEFLQNDFNQFYLEHRDGTPRIITAEELREGQVVIEYFWDLSANYGHIVSLHADEGVGHATIRTEDGELEATAFGGPGGTIVLLEDAPTSDGDGDADQDDKPIYVGPQPPYSHAIRPDGRIFSYDQAKHIKDGDPETKPAPRLTVHALNTAPEGSELHHHENRVKHMDYWWLTREEEQGSPWELETVMYAPLTSEAVMATGLWDAATLTYPEATP